MSQIERSPHVCFGRHRRTPLVDLSRITLRAADRIARN
jgi:hypothetical protein